MVILFKAILGTHSNLSYSHVCRVRMSEVNRVNVAHLQDLTASMRESCRNYYLRSILSSCDESFSITSLQTHQRSVFLFVLVAW